MGRRAHDEGADGVGPVDDEDQGHRAPQVLLSAAGRESSRISGGHLRRESRFSLALNSQLSFSKDLARQICAAGDILFGTVLSPDAEFILSGAWQSRSLSSEYEVKNLWFERHFQKYWRA